MSLTRLRSMLRTACGSIAIVLGVATLATSDDARIPDKPITADERDHWAFQPPRRSEPPVVKDRKWVRNPIDAFIRAGLEANGLSPAPEADRTTLLRRLSFDLTGLPPSPDEIEAFLNDRSADAYEKVVDRLLASPQYGVRWAQHWLDLARYADTDGFEFDQARPNAWRYRDWVVDALNRDLPYDQFVRLQLAGDEVAPDDPAVFIATGFQSLLSGYGRPERPGAEAAECLERHHRDDGPGLPRPDDRLRPLSRPQVRPDPPGGFLPAPGVLHPRTFSRRLSARLDRPSQGSRAGHRRLAGRGREGPGGHPPHREADPRPARAGPAHGLARRRRGRLQQARVRAQSGRGFDGLRDPQPGRADQGQGLAGPARQDRARRAASVAGAAGPVEEGGTAAPADRPRDRRGRAKGTADVLPQAWRVHRAGTGRRAVVPVGSGNDGARDRTDGRDDRAPQGAGRLADAPRPSARPPG